MGNFSDPMFFMLPGFKFLLFSLRAAFLPFLLIQLQMAAAFLIQRLLAAVLFLCLILVGVDYVRTRSELHAPMEDIGPPLVSSWGSLLSHCFL